MPRVSQLPDFFSAKNRQALNRSDCFPSLVLGIMGLTLQMPRWYQDKWTSSTGNLPKGITIVSNFTFLQQCFQLQATIKFIELLDIFV